ncbi:hypothetical protein [Sorangium sp. So ce1078]|uniref:hypothetical protein n=1 Tax=Sorangium sp. So ce1078 TaxID=3133329 RepID=UPI003F5D9120
MSLSIREELWNEFRLRGFSHDGESPHGTIGLTDSYSTGAELAELLELMVARREKIFRSVDAVGQAAARESYDDVVLVIEAVKAVIGRLSLV